MTNKPMLSVERELLATALKADASMGASAIELVNGWAAMAKLRALLDKPAGERKPFAWYRVPKDFPLQGAFFQYIEGQSERDIKNSLDAEFGFYVKRLYDEPAAQHHGEPVEEKSAALQDMTDLFVEAHDESVAVGKANFVLAALEKIYDSGYRKQPMPVADSTTSDKYRAELYDEVWQKARDMGFNNVTDALAKVADPVAAAQTCCGSCPGGCVIEAEKLNGVKPERCLHCNQSGGQCCTTVGASQ